MCVSLKNLSLILQFYQISDLFHICPFCTRSYKKLFLNKSFIEDNDVFDQFQFRSSNSTGSALLKVHNGIALSVDAKHPVILVLLDLTVAFDTVDHTVLLSHLNQYVGISGTARRWFTSYLTDQSLSVMIGDLSSSRASLSCGVPQGSVSGPTLFSLYMLQLGSFIAKHKLSFHCYADDIQIYLPVQPTESCLQLVQNAGACLLTNTPRREYITPVLYALHWLPV